MNKTKKMQEIEQKFGMNLEELLRQKYEVERKSSYKIAELMGVGRRVIRSWFNKYKIPLRNISEALLVNTKNPGERQLTQWYEVEKKSSVEIGELVGVKSATIIDWLHDYKIPVKSAAESRFGVSKNPGAEQLRKWYEIEGKNAKEIAELLGVTGDTVGYWLHSYKIPIRSKSEVQLSGKKKPGEGQLRQWYEVEKKSSLEIAELVGVVEASVWNWLHNYKIPVRNNSEAMLVNTKNPGEKQLKQWYKVEKKSSVEISELVGVDVTSVLRWMRRYKIPVRSAAESNFGVSKNPGEEKLRQLYETDGKSTLEIGELVGVADGTVNRWLREYKIPIRICSESHLSGKKRPSEEELKRLYVEEKKSTKEIAKLFGFTSSTIGNWLCDYKIPVRSISEAHLNGKKKPNEEQLKQWYLVERKNTVEIGELVGVAPGTVCYWLRDCKIPVRTLSEALLKGKQKPNKEQLRQWYIIEGKNTYEIAESLNLHNSTISKLLREYKIPIKNQDTTRELKKEALEKVIKRYAA